MNSRFNQLSADRSPPVPSNHRPRSPQPAEPRVYTYLPRSPAAMGDAALSKMYGLVQWLQNQKDVGKSSVARGWGLNHHDGRTLLGYPPTMLLPAACLRIDRIPISPTNPPLFHTPTLAHAQTPSCSPWTGRRWAWKTTLSSSSSPWTSAPSRYARTHAHALCMYMMQ